MWSTLLLGSRETIILILATSREVEMVEGERTREEPSKSILLPRRMKTYRHDHQRTCVPKDIVQHFMHLFSGHSSSLLRILITCFSKKETVPTGKPKLCNYQLLIGHILFHAIVTNFVIFLIQTHNLTTITKFTECKI